jgi:hypothetical protein
MVDRPPASVIPEAARTAKLPAVPRFTAVVAALTGATAIAQRIPLVTVILIFFIDSE